MSCRKRSLVVIAQRRGRCLNGWGERRFNGYTARGLLEGRDFRRLEIKLRTKETFRIKI